MCIYIYGKHGYIDNFYYLMESTNNIVNIMNMPIAIKKSNVSMDSINA